MARARVKFGRMEYDQGYRHDGGTMDILLNGEEIGVIESEFDNIASDYNPEWRVGAYNVRFWGLPAELDKHFEFDASLGIARTVLANVKDYVRETVAEYL